MKKIWVICLLTVFTATGAFAKQVQLSAEPGVDTSYQDSERSRELLEIWKDHVKTLTKERDDAYRELEKLKSSSGSGAVAQFAGVETIPMRSAETAQQIEGLQSEVSRLQTELRRKASGDPNREMQMQFSALQRQMQQVKKELNEARSEKDRLIQEKERALSQAERLESEVGSLRSDDGSVSTDERTRSVQKAYDIQKKRYEDLEQRFRGLERENEALRQQGGTAPAASPATGASSRRAQELEYEVQTLKAQIEKLQVGEKELASTRAYFTPLVKELQQKNEALSDETLRMRADADRVSHEAQRAAAEIAELQQRAQTLNAEAGELRSERDQITSQLENYKAQSQAAAADRQELTALREQHESLQKAYAVIEKHSQGNDSRVDQMSSQLSTLEKQNRELALRETALRGSTDKYRTALAANLTDMKNLKSNFQAYLESLVASFEERSK